MSNDDAYIPPPIEEDGAMTGFELRKLKDLLREKMRREMEALRLYEPLPVQAEFHASTCSERILRGSNRGGKTTPAMVEVARAVAGMDPHDKYPKRNGRCVLVANSETQLAEVFYRKLFRAGAFKMIFDKKEGRWRAFRPWDQQDKEREKEAKPALPLIPPRMVEDIGWKNKKKQVPGIVRLTNGWEILFATCGSSPPNGIDVDLVAFDEEVEGMGWYAEMSARLLDRKGKFIWSATPQNGTEDLYDLSQRAADPDDPDVAEFRITLADNPHIAQAEKEKLKRKFASRPEEYRVRIEGEFALASYRVYPMFSTSRELHGSDRIEITDRFNRYLVVDPGRQVCAVQFWAVPPPEHPRAGQRFLYDELYISNCTALKFAREVEHKVRGQQFVDFIIDPAAFKIEVGSGRSVAAQYAEELRKRNIASLRSGHNFTPATNARRAGIEKASSWMDIQPGTGRPILQVVEEACPMFIWEIERYRKKKVQGVIIDDPVDRNDHLMDCFRYLAMYDPEWTEPPKPPRPRSYVLQLLDAWNAQEEASQTREGILIGPGAF